MSAMPLPEEEARAVHRDAVLTIRDYGYQRGTAYGKLVMRGEITDLLREAKMYDALLLIAQRLPV